MSVYRIRCEVCHYVNLCMASSSRTDSKTDIEENLGCHFSIRNSYGGQLLMNM